MINFGGGYGQSKWENSGLRDLLPKQSDGRFFHYTSLSSAIQMLRIEERRMTLFASHFLYLNDSQEFKEGILLLDNKLRELVKSNMLNSDILYVCNEYYKKFENEAEILSTVYPNHFVISFCKDGNSLGQWKYYGKNCGIAIEYDLKNLNYDGYYTWERKHLGAYPIYDIIYEDIEKEQVIDNILKRFYSISRDFEYQAENLILKACAAVSFMKSSFFNEEKESRLLFAPIFDDDRAISLDNDPMQLIHYRETMGKIKPYLKIFITHKDSSYIPIKSITIGPGHNQMQIFNAITMLVQSYYTSTSKITSTKLELSEDTLYNDGCRFVDVNGIRVRVSSIPFRE